MTTTQYPITKVSLRGPAPFGGSYHAPIDDPAIARLLADGWVETRRWEVTGDRTIVELELGAIPIAEVAS